MKLTKKNLERLITEELNEGFFDRFFGKKGDKRPVSDSAFPHSGETEFDPGEIKVLIEYYHTYEANSTRPYKNQVPDDRYVIMKIDISGVKRETDKIVNPSVLSAIHSLMYRNIPVDHEQELLERFIIPLIDGKYATNLDTQDFFKYHYPRGFDFTPLPLKETAM